MQATTPIDHRVLDKMTQYYLEMFGNAHSRTHMYGWGLAVDYKPLKTLKRLKENIICL